MSDAGPSGRVYDREVTLRLLWPQWQGAGTSSAREFAPEFPFDVARRGYAVADVTAAVDVVGLTIAEFIPRQDIHLQQVLQGFPLV